MEYVFVNTENGKIGGTTERGMRVFAGIPYARAERFGLPETTSWDGVFNATEFGECCPQKRAYYDESVYAPFYHREFRKGVDFIQKGIGVFSVFLPYQVKSPKAK